jgi:hypothetical protein
VAFWVALTMVNLVGVCCGWTGWSAPTTESWRYDADVGFAAAFIAFIAFGLAGFGGLLTLIAVAGRWVTRWWYAGPVLVAAMSLLAWIGAGRF